MTQKNTNATLDKAGWAVLFAGLLTLVGRRFLPVAAMAAWFDRLTYAGTAVAIIGAVLIAWANRRALREAAGTRQAKYGANSVVLTLAVIGIIGLLNYLGSRYHWRFDLTEAKTFSISEQTKQLVSGLNEDVKVTAFYQENNPSRQQVKDLLSNYEYASPHLKVTFIDPDRQPAVAQQYGIERYGTTIFEKGDRKEKVTSFSEQDFTSALIKLMKRKETKVYFVEGHGEANLEEFGDMGISKFKEALGKDHYAAEPLVLPAKQAVPSDADVVAVIGPKNPLSAREVELLDGYLAKGGKVLITLEPNTNPGLDSLLAKYGLKADNDLVIDPLVHSWTDVATPAVNRYRWHEITKSLNGTMTFFPRARSITLAEKQPGGQVGSVLAETSPAGWGETDTKNPNVAYNAGVDVKGPVALGVAVSKDAPDAPKPKDGQKPAQTRLVVFGDSTFLANTVLTQNAANGDLALNAVSWLAQEESLIAIRPKPPQSHQITLNNQQMQGIFFGSVLGLPVAVLALGVFVWYRRR